MNTLALSLMIAGCTASLVADDVQDKSVRPPEKRNLHLYLLLGQSNMAGRGDVGPEDTAPHPRVLVFTTNATWELAIEPVTKDREKPRRGVGPALAFGKAMASHHPGVTIGLVPCALGGTPLSRWMKGGDLYENAVRRATAAMNQGQLKGVLWHQGEQDCSNEENARTYAERLSRMIADIRADLNAPQLPFVVAQLGEFLYERKEAGKPTYARVVNEALASIPILVPHTACVSSSGLKDKGDQLHFDAASQRQLGRRYAATVIRTGKKTDRSPE